MKFLIIAALCIVVLAGAFVCTSWSVRQRTEPPQRVDAKPCFESAQKAGWSRDQLELIADHATGGTAITDQIKLREQLRRAGLPECQSLLHSITPATPTPSPSPDAIP